MSSVTGVDGSLGHSKAHLSQATEARGLIFVSGQVAFGDQGEIVAVGDVAGQTRHILGRIKRLLEEMSSGVEEIASVNAYLKDISRFAEFDRAYAEFFGAHRPARATVQATLAISDLLVEIQVVAVRG